MYLTPTCWKKYVFVAFSMFLFAYFYKVVHFIDNQIRMIGFDGSFKCNDNKDNAVIYI